MTRNNLFFVEDYIRRLCEITEGCRPDMHEPDEQGLEVELYEGFGLDNAVMSPPRVWSEKIDESSARTHIDDSDAGFWLIRDKGEPTERREWFNLACLIAIVRTGPWRT